MFSDGGLVQYRQVEVPLPKLVFEHQYCQRYQLAITHGCICRCRCLQESHAYVMVLQYGHQRRRLDDSFNSLSKQ